MVQNALRNAQEADLVGPSDEVASGGDTELLPQQHHLTVFTEKNCWSAISCTVATGASSGNSTSSRGVSFTAAGAAAAPS